jgi:alkylhydroperoxidase family enzyme
MKISPENARIDTAQRRDDYVGQRPTWKTNRRISSMLKQPNPLKEIHMARVEVPAGDGREASRIWQLAPLMGIGMAAMGKAMYEDSSLPVRLREVARMRIAQLNECSV